MNIQQVIDRLTELSSEKVRLAKLATGPILSMMASRLTAEADEFKAMADTIRTATSGGSGGSAWPTDKGGGGSGYLADSNEELAS